VHDFVVGQVGAGNAAFELVFRQHEAAGVGHAQDAGLVAAAIAGGYFLGKGADMGVRVQAPADQAR